MNDNPPRFDTDFYAQMVVRSLAVRKRVMGVLAIDEDMGLNAEVEYYLVDNPGDYFRIDKETGGLYLNKTLSQIPVSIYKTPSASVLVHSNLSNNCSRIEHFRING